MNTTQSMIPPDSVDSIVEIEHETPQKCTSCSYKSSRTFRLESEDSELDVCGDCFTAWLVKRDTGVILDHYSDTESDESDV